MLRPAEYIAHRQNYSYPDPDCRFTIREAGRPDSCRAYHGIFPRDIPATHGSGITLRQFENIVQTVFSDCAGARAGTTLTEGLADNLREVSAAIVHWKMASQGGRAARCVMNMRNKWNRDTVLRLIDACASESIKGFCIGGVRIPTASAFMRFLFPDSFGIMDSRVVKITQARGITTLKLREDGYIIDCPHNITCYEREYVPFLWAEAAWLKAQGFQFTDKDVDGAAVSFSFRPCDVEMALFSSPTQGTNPCEQ